MKYNKLFFNNELPHDITVRFESLSDAHGDSHIPSREIRIDKAYAKYRSIWRLTLIHEMIHFKIWPKFTHGKEFLAELRRLAQYDEFLRLL